MIPVGPERIAINGRYQTISLSVIIESNLVNLVVKYLITLINLSLLLVLQYIQIV